MIIMYIICQALGHRLACCQLKHKSTVNRYFTLKGYYERQLSISWIWSIIDPFFNTLVCAVVLVVFIVFISCCSFDTLNLTIVDHVSEVQSYGHDSYQRCLGRVHIITIKFCLSQSIFMAYCVNVPLIKV